MLVVTVVVMSEPCISKIPITTTVFYMMAVAGYASNTYLCCN